MFDIGFSELLVIGVMGLIILGPERLPKAARTLGLLLGKIRRTMSGIQQEIEQEVRNQEVREKLENPMHSYLSDDELKQREEAEELDRLANGEGNADDIHKYDDHDKDVDNNQVENSIMNNSASEQLAKQHAEEPK